MTAEDMAMFDARRAAANDLAAAQIRKTEAENAEYVAGLYQEVSEVFMTEEQRKIAAVKKTYAETRKQLQKDLEAGNLTQQQYDDLLLGWYYGDKEKSLLALSLEIVKSVGEHFNIKRENIIFFGSSGGGYASIYAASLLNGTLAIALNPQVYIQSFQQTKAFERITGFDLHVPDLLHRNDPAYMIKNSSSKFCVIYNQQSTFDMFQISLRV